MTAIRAFNPRDIKLKPHKSRSHKGDNGRLLIIGGSEDYPGAVALAGLAGLRSGCDYVTVVAPEKAAWAVNCLTPDIVTVKLKGKRLGSKHFGPIMTLASKTDAVVIGNGIGQDKDTRTLVKRVVRAIDRPMVIDADGLKAVSLKDISRHSSAILTPHIGEYKILLSNSGLKKEAGKMPPSDLVRKSLGKNVLLVKGPTDYIATCRALAYNRVHHPAMTVAGTGDVLAGLCGGFLAQGYSPFAAACYGAYFNGLTGKMIALKKKRAGLIASDIIHDLSHMMGRFKRNRRF